MRGLLAIEPLYHQIVAGNKTQTRRDGGLQAVNQRVELIIDENNHGHYKEVVIDSSDEWEKAARAVDSKGGLCEQYFMPKGGGLISYVNSNYTCKPRYKVGEVLYLKEPTAIVTTHDNPETHLTYKYDLSDSLLSRCVLKWSNKLFMPASAARAFVRITGIKCERLLDISDEDCVAEGIEYYSLSNFSGWYNYLAKPQYQPISVFNNPKDSFISLFRLANKIKASAPMPNPWVWCYTFEYLKGYKP